MAVDHQKEEEFKLIKESKVINKNWKELIKPKKKDFNGFCSKISSR